MNVNKKADDGFEIQIENIDKTDGYWTLDKNQFVPSIIHWKCPICGNINSRDCRWESFENPPLNDGFAISLICGTPGCQYVRVVMLKITMALSVEEIAPMTVEEFNMMEEIFKKDKKNEAMKQFIRKGHRGIFLRGK